MNHTYVWLSKSNQNLTSEQLVDCYFDPSGNMICATNPGNWVAQMTQDNNLDTDSLGDIPDDSGQNALDIMNIMTPSYDMHPLKLPGDPHLAWQQVEGVSTSGSSNAPTCTSYNSYMTSISGPNSLMNSKLHPPVEKGAPWNPDGVPATTSRVFPPNYTPPSCR